MKTKKGAFHRKCREYLNTFRRELIADSLSRHRGNVTHAANDLGLPRTFLHRLIRDLKVKTLK